MTLQLSRSPQTHSISARPTSNLMWGVHNTYPYTRAPAYPAPLKLVRGSNLCASVPTQGGGAEEPGRRGIKAARGSLCQPRPGRFGLGLAPHAAARCATRPTRTPGDSERMSLGECPAGFATLSSRYQNSGRGAVPTRRAKEGSGASPPQPAPVGAVTQRLGERPVPDSDWMEASGQCR